MVSITRIGVFALAVSAFALTGAIASADQSTMTQVAAKPSATTKAAALRSALDQLLGEHVQLAAHATKAARNGRDSELKAAASALDANSVDIAGAIGSIYGKDAGDAFLGLWRSHI